MYLQLNIQDMVSIRHQNHKRKKLRKMPSVYMITLRNALALRNQILSCLEDQWEVDLHPICHQLKILIHYFWCPLILQSETQQKLYLVGHHFYQSLSMKSSGILTWLKKLDALCSSFMANRILWSQVLTLKNYMQSVQWNHIFTCQRKWIIMNFNLMKILLSHSKLSSRSWTIRRKNRHLLLITRV